MYQEVIGFSVYISTTVKNTTECLYLQCLIVNIFVNVIALTPGIFEFQSASYKGMKSLLKI